MADADRLEAAGDAATAERIRAFVRARPAWYVGGMNQLLHVLAIGYHGTSLLCIAWFSVAGEMPPLWIASGAVTLIYVCVEIRQGPQKGRAWDIASVAIGSAAVAAMYREIMFEWPVSTVQIDARNALVYAVAALVLVGIYSWRRR